MSKWDTIRLKYACIGVGQYGANIPASEYKEQGVRFLRTTDITDLGELTDNSKGVFVSAKDVTDFILEDGDLLLSRSGTLGQAYLHNTSLNGVCAFAGYLVRFRPRSNICPKFLFYVSRSSDFLAQIQADAIETTIANFNAEKYGNIKILLPPLTDQQFIAKFLDEETTTLDNLISEKQHLLELLEEKRRALITGAITRGLSPNTSLHDTGFTWLGEVPEGWRVERLKFHLAKIEQGWSPQCESYPAGENEWGVLKVGAVNGWIFNPNENKRLPDDIEPLAEYEVKEGDILMSRANTTELLGSVAIVRAVRPKLLFSDKLYRLVQRGGALLPDYLVYFFRSMSGRFEFERDATGASNSMQNIGQDSVRNVWVLIPPLDEQAAIVTYIETETRKLDELHIETERTISLLKERRAALITAAVTGHLTVGVQT